MSQSLPEMAQRSCRMTDSETVITAEDAWPRLGLRPPGPDQPGGHIAWPVTLSLAFGSVRIPLGDVLTILLGGEPAKATWTNIVLKFRLPKALTATIAGAALAVSGLQMQTLFRNPLAGPFVLGISSGASLGVALVVLAAGSTGSTLLAGLGLLGDIGLVTAASVGSASVLVLVLLVARRMNTMTLLILGLLFGYATSAIVSVLLYFSIAERIQTHISWTFGSFGGVTWSQMRVLLPTVLLGLLVAVVSAKPLNILLLGETYARSMGLSVSRARFWIILSATILAGAITAFCGPIAFLGIAVPHMCRNLFSTSDHRVIVPAAALMGGCIALIADLTAQMPGSNTILPLNAVTALVGPPIWPTTCQPVDSAGSAVDTAAIADSSRTKHSHIIAARAARC